MISLQSQRKSEKDLERYMQRDQQCLSLDWEVKGVFKYSSLCLFCNVFQNYMPCFFVIRKNLIKKLTTFKNPISSQVEAETINTKVELKETEVSEHYDGP